MIEQDFKTFLINLDRSPARLADMTVRLQGVGLPFTRIEAVDGRALSDEQRAAYDSDLALAWFGLTMLDNELACYHSHLKALRTFVDSGAGYGLILEDDVEVPRKSVEILTSLIAETHRRNIRFSLFQTSRQHGLVTSRRFRLIVDGFDIRIQVAHRLAYLTGGVLWSRAGAKRFLAEQSRLVVPIDIAVAHFAAEHQDALCSNYTLIRQKFEDSDILDGDPERRTRRLPDFPDFRAIDSRRMAREQKVARLARRLARLGLLSLIWPKVSAKAGTYMRASR
jgi:glycosyl transferase, family 25